MSIKSTAIFNFLLKNFQKLIKFITRSYLFITSEFTFILKQIFCLPKKVELEVFQGPGFSGSRFFRVHVFRVRVQRPRSGVQGPGSGSRLQKQPYHRQRKEMISVQSTMVFFQYIVKILMLIDFKYSRKYFQHIVKSLTPFLFV